jgi:hypothetical protein
MIWNPPKKESEKAEEKQEEKKEMPTGPVGEELQRKDEWFRVFMPRGAILRADLDLEHWLSSGATDKVPVILYTDFALMSKSPVQTVARLAGADSLRLSGLLWPEGRDRWAKTAYLTRENLGKGQIILFAFDANFRGYFHGSERLLINALLFGPGLGTTRPAPW